MYEQVVALLMEEAEAPIEVLVRGGELELLSPLAVAEEAVARQRAIAAVHQERVAAEVAAALPTEEVEQHRLVIPEQEGAGHLPGELDQARHHAGRIGPAIHVVAEEHQPVTGRGRELVEQALELLELAVDVADRVEHAPSSARPRDHLYGRRAPPAGRTRRRCRRHDSGAASSPGRPPRAPP